MRLISIANSYSGMELAKPIYTETGMTLIGVGVPLTERMILALKERHISHLYIKDRVTDDLEVIDDVPMEYPRGLKGDKIHPFAKIMAIADVFDALTSNRSYRNAMLPHEAMEVLYAGANTHFEADIVKTFRQSVATYPTGLTVKLNTGETAVVVQYLFKAPNRPIIRVVKDSYGKDLIKPYELDLSKNLTLMITECDAIM